MLKYVNKGHIFNSTYFESLLTTYGHTHVFISHLNVWKHKIRNDIKTFYNNKDIIQLGIRLKICKTSKQELHSIIEKIKEYN